MKKKHPPINWAEVDFVVGTLEDVTHTGINRPCRRCTRRVYTSMMYPVDVSIICIECALELAREERKGPGQEPRI